MGGIKRRYILRESEKKALIKRFSTTFNISGERLFGDKPKVEVAELNGKKIFIVNGEPLLLEVEGHLIPTLATEEIINNLPRVTVDMGAVPHICNGADVMAPGIIGIDGEFKAGDLAVVLDEKHGKAIAIAEALVDSDTAKGLKRGRTFKNLHHIGDPIWRILREEGYLKRKS